MEIQDAKQARPHCELIAELLDSRQPKTEREHAAVREIERMRHDIERHIAIASEHATECERLRAELAECRQKNALLREALDDAAERMDRARGIIRTPHGVGWAMLDTTTQRAALASDGGAEDV